MGRRLHVSQPMVINTELQPLQESLYLEANASTEQWYNDNNDADSRWSPNRLTTPLTLTPRLSVVDTETNVAYKPTIQSVRYYANEYDTTKGDYVEKEITETDPKTSGSYYKQSSGEFTLFVKKNVEWNYGVTIRAVVTYIDPRDKGTLYELIISQSLITNRDAKAVYPIIEIDKGSTQTFNPLADSTLDDSEEPHGYFEMTAKALLDNKDISSTLYWVWYGKDENGKEVLVDTLPWYVSGQNTATIKVDAMWSENIVLIARCKASKDSDTLYPSRCYRSIVWQIPSPQIHTYCKNGQASRSTFKDMTFATLVNVAGASEPLNDVMKAVHMRFNWKSRKSNESGEADQGWGVEMTLPISVVGNVRNQTTGILPNTIVKPDVLVMGAYTPLTNNNQVVTHNGQVVYHRS